jgi:hypothetical protein
LGKSASTVALSLDAITVKLASFQMLFGSELEWGWFDMIDGKDEIEELVEVFGLKLVVGVRVGLDKRFLGFEHIIGPLANNGRGNDRFMSLVYSSD